MDSGYEGSGSGNKQTSNSRTGKKPCHRLSTQQIQKLEANPNSDNAINIEHFDSSCKCTELNSWFFKECPHPRENQRRQLSRELSLDLNKIMFWFQNKRTQTKVHQERTNNSTLRSENERMYCENLAMKEALNNIICPTCDGLGLGKEERQCNIQKLRMENALLKKEHERMLNSCSSLKGELPTLLQMESLGIDTSMSVPGRPFFGRGTGCPSLDPEQIPQSSLNIPSQFQLREIQEMEKSIIIGTAAAAMDELVQLLQVNEPEWIKSPRYGRYLITRDSRDKLFPKANHFKSSGSQIEFSKDSGIVAMATTNLIEMLLDSNKWKDMFPTIVTNAQTLEVIDSGSLDGSLYLMYEKMHILSPLVAPREFFFIRYFRQLNSNMWIIANVSYDFIKEIQDASSSPSWKLPSGCMIEDMSNGKSMMWIHSGFDRFEMERRTSWYLDMIRDVPPMIKNLVIDWKKPKP
ncbi:homeobox-leucine zipper protein HDG11-like [Olea europaea var. sylvestris]|uniref:homeobox-leucine zipper protein HDG11-like n=1 Tax=Olea europaea var. sylvestris TaxID=158386 RepID=UPI000C1D51FC|nr:homeobox-leucine zipper protein HDG11-like [Olea europaea var. sylvestris]